MAIYDEIQVLQTVYWKVATVKIFHKFLTKIHSKYFTGSLANYRSVNIGITFLY